MPAGYLAARAALPRTVDRAVFAAVLVGAVVPDLDMLWFHLVDHGTRHHHDYLTHRPALWRALGLLAAIGWRLGHWRRARVGLAACAGAMLHLFLDSIAGKIAWA